ncbi:MAG: competence protein ComEC, partial [Cryptosporangiaceae bacterium]|nr:competence protein ComEC [Cryptosporangiaceae bacterium]
MTSQAGVPGPGGAAVLDPPVAGRPGADLRLAGAACGAWLAALAALGGGARAAVLESLVAVLAAAGLAVAARAFGHRGRSAADSGSGSGARWTAVAWVLAAIAIGSGAGSGACAARIVTRDDPVIAGLAKQRSAVTAELVIRDDPRAVGAGGSPIRSYAVDSGLVSLTAHGRRVDAGAGVLVLASDPAWRSLLPGQRVRAEGRLASPRGGDLTAAVLSARGAPELLGRPPWYQLAAASLRAGLQRACAGLPPEAGGLLPGLVLGDVSRLDPAVEDTFRATGMTHLVAVSGSNVAVVAGLVLFAARRCRAGPRAQAVLAGAALAGFVVLVRPSPSVLRAAVMGAVALVALAARRPRSAVPALGGTVFVLVLADPSLARSAGFALSTLATAGLLLIAPGWRDALRRRHVPAGLAEALAVPAAAQVACAPVIAAMTGTISLSAIPANLLAVPAVAPATILGVLAAVVSPVLPWLAAALAWLASWPARWLVLVAGQGSALPGSAVPWLGGSAGGLALAGILLALVVFGSRRPVRRVLVAVAAAVSLVMLPVRVLAPGWPPTGWIVAGCDVGQGDALVLNAGPGSAVVVDTGPDPQLVDQCLRRLGVTAIPLLVLTHPHQDHIGGVPGVLRGRTVAAIALGPAGSTGHLTRRVPVVHPAVGWTYAIGSVHLRVLGP